MDLDYSETREVKISMVPCVINILNGFPENITSAASTPVADCLLNVKPPREVRKHSDEQAILFHHIVAKLLFISK